MPIDTYDPAQVICTFLGNPIVGYGPDTFISVERAEDAMILAIGADGEGARARNQNRSAQITLTLFQTSASNDVLSAAAIADELTGTGVGTFQMKDLLGNTIVNASNCWVKKLPAVEFGKEVATREWVLETDELLMTVGGSL